MKLEVHERISILNLLPQQANYVGVKALRKAKEIISFNEEEREFYGLHINEQGNWEWEGAKASQRVADIPIEQYIVETIREKLAEMDSKAALTDQYTSLYEKFIINYRAVE
jgi:hypothetical protein